MLSQTRALVLVFVALLVANGASGDVFDPQTEAHYARAHNPDDLRCYFAGRWIGPNLGTADIRVQGSRLTGVKRIFDDSLARNLFEMQFSSTVGEKSRRSVGKHSYQYLTGFGRFSYAGDIVLELADDLSSMRLVYTTGFGSIENIFVKTRSGECT